jgi:AcrR family transcriptional regulator
VFEVQRARMLAAAVEIVGEVGYNGMSVARITGRAGVSRRTFYDLFEDREDCFLAVFEDAVARASVIAIDAAGGLSGWRERVRTGLAALLGFLGNEPVLGSLLITDALGGGPKVLERRARVLATLNAIVDQGRGEAKAGDGPPPLTAEGVVGAVLAVIHARIVEREKQPLIHLLNPLMGMIVLPYLGRAEAAKELARPTPKVYRKRRKRPVTDPLAGLEMRLTYRTLRVLAAIVEQPGASNRQIAEAAGVQDQGQISKLLARLEHLGLVRNAGDGALKGAPNAWMLTTTGREVEGAIHTRTGGA